MRFAQQATVYSVSTLGSSSPGINGSTSLFCQVTPMEPDAAYKSTGRDIRNPALLICSVTNGSLFKTGYEVTLGTKTYVVTQEPQVYSLGLPADHASVVLEERRA